jgi:hypothetical protein
MALLIKLIKRKFMKPIPDLIKDLMDGCSAQSKMASRLWTTTALVSIIAIMPYSEGTDLIKIPLISENVSPKDFYPFAAVLISILFIGFGSLHAQVIRSRALLQKAIESMSDKYLVPDKIHIQDVIDCILVSNMNRVAPLPQLFQGKYQFYPEANNRSKFIKGLTFTYYFLMKIMTIFVVYGLPGFALFRSISKGNLSHASQTSWGLLNICFYPFFIVAILALIQLAYSDIRFIFKVFKRIASS